MVATARGSERLSLDARIPFDGLASRQQRARVQRWIGDACKDLKIDQGIASRLRGVVFEVRQGYKSKDSKRQNADIANAVSAYTQAYLPCVLVMSSQIDTDIVHRYRSEKWTILTGDPCSSSPLASTYAFMREVVDMIWRRFSAETPNCSTRKWRLCSGCFWSPNSHASISRQTTSRRAEGGPDV